METSPYTQKRIKRRTKWNAWSLTTWIDYLTNVSVPLRYMTKNNDSNTDNDDEMINDGHDNDGFEWDEFFYVLFNSLIISYRKSHQKHQATIYKHCNNRNEKKNYPSRHYTCTDAMTRHSRQLPVHSTTSNKNIDQGKNYLEMNNSDVYIENNIHHTLASNTNDDTEQWCFFEHPLQFTDSVDNNSVSENLANNASTNRTNTRSRHTRTHLQSKHQVPHLHIDKSMVDAWVENNTRHVDTEILKKLKHVYSIYNDVYDQYT